MSEVERGSRLSPRGGVLILVLTLWLMSAAVWTHLLGPIAQGVLGPSLPWWAIAALVAAAELTVVHVQVRREAQAISLSEIPATMALFLATPREMLAGVVLGAGAVYVLHRRQSAVKATFNVTLRVFGVSVSVALFRLLAGGDPGLGPREWLAALAAVAVAGALDGVLVLAVVTLYEGTLDGHHLRRELLSYPPISAIVGTLGVVAVGALHADPRNMALLIVAGAALTAAHRAYASLNDRHVSLARLYDFGRTVSEAHQVDQVVAGVLAGARELLRAEDAELVLVDPELRCGGRRWVLSEGCSEPTSQALTDPHHPATWAEVLGGSGSLLLARGSVGPAADRLRALGYDEAVVVPVQDESGVVGTLLVAQRMGQVRTFRGNDVPLLETVANQAGLALRKGQLLDRLGYEARHDVLTGLANRAKFREVLAENLDAVEGGRSAGFAVLLLDLNGFKEVNDSLGHHNGDALLVHVAGQLVAAAEPNVTIARLGGDEFAALLPGVVTAEAAVLAATRLHQAVAEPIAIDDVPVAVGSSIGITLAPVHGRDAGRLMRSADAAMYAAKARDGGIRVHQDDPTAGPVEPAGRDRLALLAELRGAIENGQIAIHVQPQAFTRTGEVYGAEALIRWTHPDRGLLSPGDFLSLADRHGLVPELTQVVLDLAVSSAAAWRTAGMDLAVSVNLSARSLGDPRLISVVESTLTTYGLPASRLTLEITENSVMESPGLALELLQTLNQLGVRLSVDDFGTGYSSLSYLRRLPVHEVKIDRSFVARLGRDAGDQLIVRSIIDLAANMSLDVVAEGVEDRDSWDRLVELGCTAVQGFHLAVPMPAGDLAGWLTRYRNGSRAAGPGIRTVGSRT